VLKDERTIIQSLSPLAGFDIWESFWATIKDLLRCNLCNQHACETRSPYQGSNWRMLCYNTYERVSNLFWNETSRYIFTYPVRIIMYFDRIWHSNLIKIIWYVIVTYQIRIRIVPDMHRIGSYLMLVRQNLRSFRAR
jgi:hypothetical protein